MENASTLTCPRCGAPRAPAPECPRCGVYYVKAQARAAQTQAAEALEAPPSYFSPTFERPPYLPPETVTWNGDTEDARLELRIRQFALPAALLVMWVLHSTGMGHRLLRIFLSMWVHELGHAVTAWLCGFTAFPGPWATSVSEARSPFFAVLLAGAFGVMVYRGWKLPHRPMLIAGGVLLVLQLVGTLLISSVRARAWITFGGDGGRLVLGTLLMTTLYASRESSLHKGWLRWGFLAIGAAAFTDTFRTWWEARSNFAAIPFGLVEGVNKSDPTLLVDTYRWSSSAMVSRYMTLAWLCLAVLGMVYVLGVLRARAAVRA